MEDIRTDLRGVLRGPCSECSCPSFLRPQQGAACRRCDHAPGRHVNLDKNFQMSSTQPAGSYHTQSSTSTYTTSYASVAATNSSKKPAPGSQNTDFTRKPLRTHDQPASYSGHSAATTAYSHTYTPPNTCQAEGCHKTAYYDTMLGYFSYCSPQCRDEHLLPDYNKKLKVDIANFEANPPTDYMQSSSSSSSSSFKKTYGEVMRQPVIEKKPKEPLGIIFARKDGAKMMVAGLLIKKFEAQLKSGEIKLHDMLCEICDKQVGVSKAVKDVEDIVHPRTRISMMLDGTYAVNCDLWEFLKTAKGYNATHVFALWPFMQHDYGLTVMNNKESVVIYGTSENSPARECGIKHLDKVVCYSSYADKRLLETCKAKGKDQFVKDMHNAAQSYSTLILAIARK